MTRERRRFLLGVALFYGGLTAIAVVVSFAVWGTLPWEVGPGATPLWWSAAIGAALGLLVVAASRFAMSRFTWAKTLDRHFERVLGRVSAPEAFGMAAASAVGEELLFRGLFLRAFIDPAEPSTGMVVLGVAVTSLVFGGLHVGPSRSYLPWTAFAIVMGAAFAGLTLWTGDILAAVVAHFVVNFLNFLAIGTAADD